MSCRPPRSLTSPSARKCGNRLLTPVNPGGLALEQVAGAPTAAVEGVLPTGMILTDSYANHVDFAGEAVEPGYFIFTITASDPFTGCSGGRIYAVQVFECGDGNVDNEVGEVCDEGDTISGDGCSSNCLSDETCGNHYADLDEQCDGSDLKGADCTTVGLVDGVLARTPIHSSSHDPLRHWVDVNITTRSRHRGRDQTNLPAGNLYFSTSADRSSSGSDFM